MFRKLLVFLALIGLWILGTRLARAFSARPVPGRRGEAAGPGPHGTMVRDRVCQTFLPKEKAVTLLLGGEEHHFCSTACRDRYLAESGSRSPA